MKIVIKKAVSKKAVSKKAVSKKAVSKKAVPKKAVPKKAVSKKAVSKKAVSKKAVSKQVIAKKTTLKRASNASSGHLLSKPNTQYVLPIGNGWVIKDAASSSFLAITDNKREALVIAKQYSIRKGGKLVIFSRTSKSGKSNKAASNSTSKHSR